MEPYRVNLTVYNGPLDLLLYLIRRDEVDICDIPIAHVTDQYCKYVELLKAINPNLAGEFLVMAATLLEIKSRTLLPTPALQDDSDEEGLGDPRADLVRQLLQYKSFKDAAGKLQQAGEVAAMRHPRMPTAPEFEQPELNLENIQVWDLLEAFNTLMASVGRHRASHEVIYDDTPIALYAEDIVDRLTRDGDMTFAEIFRGRDSRGEIVGLFLALLELIRQSRISVRQQAVFGEIYISLRDAQDPEATQPKGTDPVVEPGAALEGMEAAAVAPKDHDEPDA